MKEKIGSHLHDELQYALISDKRPTNTAIGDESKAHIEDEIRSLVAQYGIEEVASCFGRVCDEIGRSAPDTNCGNSQRLP